jgi:hypothetical protein
MLLCGENAWESTIGSLTLGRGKLVDAFGKVGEPAGGMSSSAVAMQQIHDGITADLIAHSSETSRCDLAIKSASEPSSALPCTMTCSTVPSPRLIPAACPLLPGHPAGQPHRRKATTNATDVCA